MKSFLLFLGLFFHLFLNAQVGIGTNTPNNSAVLEMHSTDKGVLFPRLTSSQRIAINAPSSGLYVFDTDTKSLWYFNGVLWVNTVTEASYGDVKSGIQVTDHSGWVLLDGRSISTLSTSQQAIAVSLGISGTLPNAANAYLVQNGSSMGTVSGSNTTTLTQANLPNVTFSGSAASSGIHNHTVDPLSFNSGTGGSHNHTSPDQYAYTSTYTHNHGVGDGTNPYNNVAPNVPGLVRRTNGGEGFTADGIDAVFSGEEPDLRNPPKAIPNDSHSHSVYIPATTSSTASNHTHSIDVPSTGSTSDGAHTHSVTVSSGGTAIPINVAPKSLTVNMFIYLGL